MANIRPIRAITYAAEYARDRPVLSPPYDILSREDVLGLYEQDPRNAVRIEFGLDHDGDVQGKNDVYTRAASYLHTWLSEGVLEEDARPALYLSEHSFPNPERTGISIRRGIYAGIAPGAGDSVWDPDGLQPHEHTFSAPKADRLALLQATGVQTSPIFGFWDDAPDLETILAETSLLSPDMATSMEDEFGPERHRLWKIGEQRQIAEIIDHLKTSTLYIADGHHRYETTAGYIRNERNGNGTVLTYLCAASDPGLIVLPTHRVLETGDGLDIALKDLAARVGPGWHQAAADSIESVMQALADRSEQRIGVVTSEGFAVLTRALDSSLPAAQRLAVWALHHEVIPAVSEGADVSFVRSAIEAVGRVQGGNAAAAFLLPPATTLDVMAVAREGDVMPQKSTYFYPKVPSGLLMTRL